MSGGSYLNSSEKRNLLIIVLIIIALYVAFQGLISWNDCREAAAGLGLEYKFRPLASSPMYQCMIEDSGRWIPLAEYKLWGIGEEQWAKKPVTK